MVHKYDEKTYEAWRGMIRRCFDKNRKDFSRYGGRGISVCDRWKSYQLFQEDMGIAPQGMSIDRIDNDGDYKITNCRWANSKTQSRNRSNVVINEAIAIKAIEMKRSGVSRKNAALNLGISFWAIDEIYRGRTWVDVRN